MQPHAGLLQIVQAYACTISPANIPHFVLHVLAAGL